MRTPVVDYRSFRLRRLNEPQFRHLQLLLGWVVWFLGFFLTEQLIPAERCTPVHMWLDDVIPFCEWFLLPYVSWYALILFSMGYFLLYDIDNFRRLQIYFIILQVLAIAIFILFPTRQDLRPTVFPRDNFLTSCIGLIYAFDTNTGVCPSMHVAFSIAIASVWTKIREVPRRWKAIIVVMVILICLSTMFIKQHSAVDFFAALPVCLVAEVAVFGRWWREKLQCLRKNA